jgi:hypothetical protein
MCALLALIDSTLVGGKEAKIKFRNKETQCVSLRKIK